MTRAGQRWAVLLAAWLLAGAVWLPPGQAREAVTHTVQPGETLAQIAQKRGVTVAELVRLNGLKNPDFLRAGQELVIAEAVPQVPVTVYTPAEPPEKPQEAPPPPPQPPPQPPPAKPLLPVALTFNDGPHPVLTPLVLEALARHGARATFFAIGREVERHPHVARQVAEGGHELANHSYSHPDLTRLPARRMSADIARGARAIQAATGADVRFFRPPFGRFDTAVEQAARSAGQRIVLWSNIGVRESAGLTPADLSHRVVRSLFPGAIIMLHDTSRTALEALPAILDQMKAAGYRPVTLSELLGGH